MQGSSTTAVTVALQRAFESHRPRARRLFSDPYADAFLHGGWSAIAGACRVPGLGRVLERLYDAVAGPGPRPSAVARTRAIDDAIAAEVAGRAIDQVVLLGAGFDSRAHRLQALRPSTVFEVDHPATQAEKRARCAACDLPLHPVVYVPVDFEKDDLVDALTAHGLRRDRSTLFLWEGVTNYLTAAAVDATLDAVVRAAPSGTLVFTYVHAGALDGTAHFPEGDRWIRSVARLGEPWTFGLLPARVPEFLAERGFTLASDESTADAGARLFPPTGRADRGSALYRIAVARFGDALHAANH
jgi:methyltransferase (TIGR00027 family)